MIRLACLFLFVYFSALKAESNQNDPFTSSLTKTQNLLPTVIQSVSVISGEWLESEVDLVVKGATPLVLARSYSTNYVTGRLGYNWEFNRPNPLVIQKYQNIEKGKGEFKARLQHSSGVSTIHEGEDGDNSIISLPIARTRALTNCQSSSISGKTNLHNTNLNINSRNKTCEAVTGNGHVIHYRLEDESLFETRYYFPQFERTANGSLILFEKDKILSTGVDQSIEYGKINLESKKLKKMKAKGSGETSVLYTFKTTNQKKKSDVKSKRYCLKKVEYTHKPQIQYEYEDVKLSESEEDLPCPFLTKKKLGSRLFQEVTYYKEGVNKIDGLKQVKISKNDFRLFRIKEIKAPVGYDNTPIVTHRFLYSSDGEAKRGTSFSGKTEVYDAEMNKTVYEYNKEHRPISICRHLKNGDVYSTEHFLWHEKKNTPSLHSFQAHPEEMGHREMIFEMPEVNSTNLMAGNGILPALIPESDVLKKLLTPKKTISPQIGNLLGKYLENRDGKIEHALFFTYDCQGNIEQERFYGNLTGRQSTPIKLDHFGMPKKGECYTKNYSYSKDAFNHLISEKEENGKEIEYRYDSKTQQISAQYIKDGEKIKLRQFFFYDPQTAALVKVIKDDGSKKNEGKLDDVTERLITDIELTSDYPVGIPKTIEEKFWDGSYEVSLKKTANYYDLKGQLFRQDHFDGDGIYRYSLSWIYDDHGNVIEETNALNHKTTKHYDENDLLKWEAGPRLEDRIEYDYDDAHRLIVLKQKTDGRCLTTQHRYDLKGNRIATINHFGQTTTYIYDEFNRLVKTIYPSALIKKDIIVHPTKEVSYDINHYPTRITDADGGVTSFTYTSRGQPLTKTYPDGTKECFEYYPDGSLAKSIASNGTQIIYQRDFLGRVIKEVVLDNQNDEISTQKYEYKGNKLISKTDHQKLLTTYQHDFSGRVISETCGKAYQTYEYDSLGRVVKVCKWFGEGHEDVSVQIFGYDLLNQMIEERLEDAWGNIIQHVTYDYDKLGNRTTILTQNAAGENRTHTHYESDGKPRLIRDQNGNETHFTYDYTHRNQLDQQVLKVIKTDPKGTIHQSIFDALGQLREVTKRDSFGRLLAKQEILYDEMGRQTQTIDSVVMNGAITRHYINEWSYHVSGQEEMFVESAGSPNQKITYTQYNTLSQKEETTKPNGTTLHYTYDSLGRVKTLKSSDGSIHYLYNYNLRHQLEAVDDLINKTTARRHYNSQGYLEKEELANGHTLCYHYDRMGRLIELGLPDDSSVSYVYDATNLKEILRYRQKNLLYRHENIQHDLSGNLLKAQLIGNTSQINYSYDRMDRMVKTTSSYWSQEVPPNGYDALGLLTEIVIEDAAGKVPYSFQYNALDQLESENSLNSHQYKIDSIDNRLQKNEISCEINDLNQLREYGKSRYVYDHNGNLSRKEKENQNTHYTYDALDRLVSISNRDIKTDYTYDAFHRRLTKTHQGIVSHYLYQGQNEIGSIDRQGEITELRVLGIGIEAEMGASIALELKGEIYAPIHDRQGNIVSLINYATGLVAETYRYTAFGEETILDGQGQKLNDSKLGNPWRFASKRKDSETDWVYFGRRYYDPEIGRWTTTDPAFFGDGSNLYAYVHHSPLNTYDAYGLYGEAYQESAEVGMNSPNYSVFCDLGRSDIGNNDQERASYISDGFSSLRNGLAGAIHGGVNFASNQFFDLASIACMIGAHEFDDDLATRLDFQYGYAQAQIAHINNMDNLIAGYLTNDPNNDIYQACRGYTTAGLEVATILAGGYGIAKGVLSGCVKVAGRAGLAISSQTTKTTGKLVAQEVKYALSSGAESANAGVNLGKKLSQLETAQATAIKTRVLPDGRVRYYGKERFASTVGATRGRSFVTENNIYTNTTRTWMECYDQRGIVNRVHPKQINGEDLLSPHYPPTARELGL